MLPRLWLLVGSDRQTMSVIELSWTAKIGTNQYQLWDNIGTLAYGGYVRDAVKNVLADFAR